jgi:hypothetical protein
MASAQEHRDWAAANERFYDFIGGAEGEWLDWAVTVAFYTIVHELSAFLADRNKQVPKGHPGMKAELSADPSWSNLLGYYESAQSDATMARYRCRMPLEQEVKFAHARIALVRAEIASLP